MIMKGLRIPSEASVLLGREAAGELPPLRPQRVYSSSAHTAIASATDLPTAVRGALHLLNDDLYSAHTLVQDDEADALSNLVHAILHRREGDFWNSKWWLDRIPPTTLSALYSNGRKEAKAFVDSIQRITSQGTATACAAQRDVADAKAAQCKELIHLVRITCTQHKVQLQ